MPEQFPYQPQPSFPPGPHYGHSPQQAPTPPRRRHTTRNVLLTLAAVGLVVGVIGSATGGDGTTAAVKATAGTSSASAAPAPTIEDTTEPAPAPEPAATETRASLGEAVTVSTDGVEVGEITVTGVSNTAVALNSFVGAPKNGHYVTVTLTARATGSSSFDLNPFYFYMRAPDGSRRTKQDGNGMMTAVDPTLNAVTLSPGEKVTGTVTLDVPEVHGAFVYAPPSLTDAALASWGF